MIKSAYIGIAPRLRIMSILLVVTSLLGCVSRYGVLESIFQLSADSRLPKWVDIPPSYSRKDIAMTIECYSLPPILYTAVMKVYGPQPEHRKLMEKVGTIRTHPITKQQFGEKRSYSVFPNYLIISVNGIEEVFEHRSKGDILYVSDEPNLRARMR